MSLFGKKISASELHELRSINNLIKEQSYMLFQVQKNTYFVNKGQQWCRTQEDIIKLLKQGQNTYVSGLARKYGFPEGVHVNVDLANGKIEKGRAEEKEKPIDVPIDIEKKGESSDTIKDK